MFWHKAWLETRNRFLVGLGLLLCSVVFVVSTYPQVARLVPLASTMTVSGEIGRQIREAVLLQRDYRGYIWSQWFRQNAAQLATLFAVLLGTGGLLSQGSRGAALFTLSLPASRRRLLGIRAASGLGELFALAVVPSLVVPLFSPLVGERYAVDAALVHGVCLFVGAAVFFSLTFLLSTSLEGMWAPLLIVLSLAIVLALCGAVFRDLARYGIFAVMSGETFFRTGRVPWTGLIVCAAASAAMLYAASLAFAKQDF
jgi:ABC-2 type transport system permease protein